MKTTRKIYTVYDAREEKYLRNGDYAAWAKEEEEKKAREEIQTILRANPGIGTLQRATGVVYYVNAPEYREACHPAELI